ncbi:conserved hypothetical protein [Crenothrix polyspora]|uniref:Uncharacterized protein n=1 Tax=Crenothrix polyspora TaxID=360316 RepID=A0A1R4GYT4_9GAMM|nr:hypothetical protein [Crenothrix polyspora]SJM89128.1 conserved hypothetical protein [Crenothrix polyspora]
MKNTQDTEQELLPEYNFDYSKAKINRFAPKKSPITVTLDADIAEVFKDSEAVNRALRAILSVLPNSRPYVG